jgi:DNA-binding SARP family transcriptional activator/predicted ATPase
MLLVYNVPRCWVRPGRFGEETVARLSLSTLGPFEVTLDREPVTGFKSARVRALLAYLAVEADRPHSRDVLAGLLWPDWPDREALSNLRYALSNLRRAIDDHAASPPFLLVSRDTLQFNVSSDAWVDVAAFTELADPAPSPDVAHGDLSRLEEAVALYRGEFLEGFSIGDSPAFEEWALFVRERLAWQVLSVLRRLSAACEQRGEYEKAQSWAWQQLEREPCDEAAHRQLMRVLVLSGQRSAALAQHEACHRVLAEELGVEPAEETTRLYEQIRDGELRTSASVSRLPDQATAYPAFLEEEGDRVERPIFVSRERELLRLDHSLDLALTGQGRVVFITGEAGSGKTALIQEFARRAQDAHGDLIVVSGNCNAHIGIGDPYLPLRQILGLLTGDVEARWAAGAITGEHARRLWSILPITAQALAEVGGGLIDTFVPGSALIGRARSGAPGAVGWLVSLEELVKTRAGGLGVSGLLQSDLFQQADDVLKAVARRVPLVLVLDDLQWADAGAISLLFHLGRQLAGSRILIIGAYRPEEVAIGRADPAVASGYSERHPLVPVVNELQREFGDIIVNVDQAERRGFVEAFLDSEPNRLGPAFREMLHRQTHGHPLFTVELLRGMQERGDLIKNPEGQWVEGPALDWETLPARVEAAIAERIGRLADPLRAALRVASVEGEEFTAEVVAHILRADEREMALSFSRELDRRHRLIRAHTIERLGSRRLSRYRFRHYLTQKYLYDTMDQVERGYLHEDVGNALEELCGDGGGEVAVQLARHFEEAGIADKAISYLHQAGEKAAQLSAYEEAIGHLTKALGMLMSLPDTTQRARDELALQLSLAVAIANCEKPERGKALVRARQLCSQVGDRTQLCRVAGELAAFYYVRAEHQRARELAEEALHRAESLRDPLLVALGHWYVGFVCYALGEFTTARAHLEQTISFYDPQQHHSPFVSIRGGDAGLSALSYKACYLWCFGFPDMARHQSLEVLALARELNHPFSLADVLCFAGCMFNHMSRDALAAKEHAEELIRLSRENPSLGWLGEGMCHRGRALVALGQVEEGIAQLREGLQANRSMGNRVEMPETLGSLAEAQAKAGQPEEGLTTLDEALALVEQTGARHWQTELYRLRAELLLMQGDDAQAEASLRTAIETARRQQAKSWELRAAITLGRLWQSQGKREQARQLLAEIYSWFTEGFETADLREARALLDELSG